MIMDFSQQIAQYVITGLTIGAIYAIVAMGFNIIHNATGIVNFAQCEFISLGGMFMRWWFFLRSIWPSLLSYPCWASLSSAL